MKKISLGLFLTLVFMTIHCKSQENNWVEYIKRIDEIPVSKSLFVFEVDSQKNILDTLAIRKLKYDKDVLIYEENFQLKPNYLSLNYYDSKGQAIYYKILIENEIITEFIAELENERIVSATQYGYWENKITDTIQMNYEYTYEGKKLKKLVINAENEFITTEIYNSFEKPILSFTTDNKKDTIEIYEFIYDQENNLIQKKYKNFQRNEEEIYFYEKDKIRKEVIIIEGSEKFHRHYFEDEKGNYLRFTEFIL